MGIMILFYQHQDIVDIDLHLADELRLEDYILRDIFFIMLFPAVPLFFDIEIPPLVILPVTGGKNFPPFEFIERRKQISHAKQDAEEQDEFLLLFFADDISAQRKLILEPLHEIHISIPVLAIRIRIAFIVVLEAAHKHDASGIFIPEERNRTIHPFRKISKADDISKRLHRIQNAVRPGKRLNEPMHLEILIHPERIQRRRIEASEEHIHHDEQIQLLILHAERDIFVIILEFIG